MIECDTPLLDKSNSTKEESTTSSPQLDKLSLEELSSSEEESFEHIEDNMDILDDDHDPSRWISNSKKYSAFGKVLEWLLPKEGLELLLVNKECYTVAK